MAEDGIDQAAMNQALLSGFSNLGKKLDELNVSVKKGTNQRIQSARASKAAFAPLTGLLKKVGVLIAGFATLASAVTGTNDRIKLTAATNIDIIRQSKKLQQSMENSLLVNELTGEAYESGARFLSGKMLTLAREMKFSGENYKALFSAYASFEGILGTNEKELTSLTTVLDETSDTYQLSTDRLVGALVKLTDTLAPLALTSGSGNTLQAMTKVAGSMGSMGMDILTPIMSQIMRSASDPAALARASAGFPGLMQFVRSMEAGASAQVQAQLLESLIKSGGTRFTGNLGDISLSQSAFGTGSLLQNLMQAKNAMGNRNLGLDQGVTGEPATIESVFADLVDPIKKLADNHFPALITEIKNLTAWWQKFGSVKVEKLSAWIDGIDWNKVKIDFQDAVGKLVSGIDKFGLAIHDIVNSKAFKFFFGADETKARILFASDNYSKEVQELNKLNQTEYDSLRKIEKSMEDNTTFSAEHIELAKQYNETLIRIADSMDNNRIISSGADWELEITNAGTMLNGGRLAEPVRQ